MVFVARPVIFSLLLLHKRVFQLVFFPGTGTCYQIIF